MSNQSIREQILELLEYEGNMTTSRIALETDKNSRSVASLLSDMHKKSIVHIDSWEPSVNGKRPAAIWAIGSDEDAEYSLPRPPADRAVIQAMAAWADRALFGPFATAMWNVTQGVR
ncbi:hypothetical protein CAL26_05095 [Bordetella genomosp. 9]|uniref:Uncharacterized protein n=1 Tax=Bordetella genomosp. 9 TaxID=1416803 RepID=A0A261RQ15_9BORD|nr:hypothetical protein [Bordetella genomosp. 9]OZI26700.1 hypothetical protein CAL26_05095 [Bordetella genomosp. 9]